MTKKAKKSAATQAKAEKKGKAAKAPEVTAAPAQDPGIDPDELEEQADIAAAASAGGASGGLQGPVPTETSVSFKNFRHHPDMENFYRFIYENDLRYEALAIIDEVLTEKRNRKKLKAEKTKTH